MSLTKRAITPLIRTVVRAEAATAAASARLAFVAPHAVRLFSEMPVMPYEEQENDITHMPSGNIKVGDYRRTNGMDIVVRNDWTREEIDAIYNLPLMELVFRAAAVHRAFFDPLEVQQCTLLSIKTGGCTEDCKYCSQSVNHKTHVKPTPTMKVQEVLAAAERARVAGSTRFCMGAAWRELGNKKNAFNNILTMVKEVNKMGMEVCCTLGMLSADQAKQLKEAGLTAYNHNLDTSPEYYPKVITTRTFEDRLQTIANVREAGISVCSGGILGLGEGVQDRVGLLHSLATMAEHPESVPINALVAVEGTPMEESDAPDAFDMVRAIATARCIMPKSMVRLSAGRMSFSEAEQALLFMSGANSVFSGDKLLTTPNPEVNEDTKLFERLGLRGKRAFTQPLHVHQEQGGQQGQQGQGQQQHEASASASASSPFLTVTHVQGTGSSSSSSSATA